MNIKRKILTGILSGALLLTGAQALANPPEMPDDDKFWEEEATAHTGGRAKYISEKYGVDAAQVEAALNDGVHFGDVKFAAALAKLSGKSFSEVLAMKVDWAQVAEKLGVTREQLKAFHEQERDEHFAKMAGVEVKTFKSLLNDGYNPHDIMIAGKIAQASNKNIKSVLDKRKINNSWDDVAKSFGVDLKSLVPHGHPHSK